MIKHTMCCIAILISIIPAIAFDLKQERFDMLLSFTHHSGSGADYERSSVSTNGHWLIKEDVEGTIHFDLKSRYEIDMTTDDEVRDLLELEGKWVGEHKNHPPIAILRLRGDHTFNETFGLIAFGYRHTMGKGNFIELTGGFSKELHTGDDWSPDFGLEFMFRKEWGKLSLGVNPGANYAIEGRARTSDGDVRIIYDQGLNYTLSEHLSLSWQLEYENLNGEEETHSTAGIRYHWR